MTKRSERSSKDVRGAMLDEGPRYRSCPGQRKERLSPPEPRRAAAWRLDSGRGNGDRRTRFFGWREVGRWRVRDRFRKIAIAPKMMSTGAAEKEPKKTMSFAGRSLASPGTPMEAIEAKLKEDGEDGRALGRGPPSSVKPIFRPERWVDFRPLNPKRSAAERPRVRPLKNDCAGHADRVPAGDAEKEGKPMCHDAGKPIHERQFPFGPVVTNPAVEEVAGEQREDERAGRFGSRHCQHWEWRSGSCRKWRISSGCRRGSMAGGRAGRKRIRAGGPRMKRKEGRRGCPKPTEHEQEDDVLSGSGRGRWAGCADRREFRRCNSGARLCRRCGPRGAAAITRADKSGQGERGCPVMR